MRKPTAKGKVIWLTGLSGTGKTTLGAELLSLVKKRNPATVHLDGDVLRELLGKRSYYSLRQRQSLAMQYSKLCKLLSDQGINVICSTISLFHACHEWNRKNIRHYTEIYLEAPFSVLKKRDYKGVYQAAKNKPLKNIVGVDLAYQKPKRPHLILVNDGKKSPQELMRLIMNSIRPRFD